MQSCTLAELGRHVGSGSFGNTEDLGSSTPFPASGLIRIPTHRLPGLSALLAGGERKSSIQWIFAEDPWCLLCPHLMGASQLGLAV